MLKFRKILLLNRTFYLILIFGILLACIRLFVFPIQSNLTGKEQKIEGTLKEVKMEDEFYTLTIRVKKEFLKAYYWVENSKEKEQLQENLIPGYRIVLFGTLEKPSNRRVENGFSSSDYLRTEHIFYLMQVDKIKIFPETNLYYIIKNKLRLQIEKCKRSSSYLQTFLLGDQSGISKRVRNSFQKNGISHLFAISGMHITFLSSIFLKLLKRLKWKEKQRYFFVGAFLLFYLFFTFSASVLRATLFFILFSLNQIYYFYIKPFHIGILTFTLCLIIEPYFLFQIGFQFSFLISFSLILGSDYINRGKNYITKLLRTSFLSFFSGSIISLWHFYELNFFSIIYNIFYVPFVSLFLFPLSFFTFFFPIFDSVFFHFISILEKTSLFLMNNSFGTFIFGKPSIFILILYFLIFGFSLFSLQKGKTAPFLLFFPFFFVLYFLPNFSHSNYLYMLDIGQGDSILLKSKNQVMLIDTGGKFSYSKKTTSLVENITIPYLKSKGIRKIDYLILTHGDYDHLGEANVLLSQFRVSNIYINSNSLNFLEKQLQKRNQVEKLKKDQTFQMGDMSFYSLNGNLGEENDSSIVLLLEVFSKKILLMGDASCETEKNILREYQLPKVEILKVGHHGSKTSSCLEFLKTVSPHYALISAGIDNRFHHPHSVIIERLRKLGIEYFVTSEVGSIRISFPTFDIETFS